MTDVVATRPTLEAFIRQVIDGSEDAIDPDAVANQVVEMIDPFEYSFYLKQAVKNTLSSVTSERRASVTPVIRKGVSTKQSLIRDKYWPQFLQQQIALPTGYKRLADATSDDLRFLAQARRTTAQELMHRAEQFSTLATLMDKNKIRVLEDLSPEMGERTLASAA